MSSIAVIASPNTYMVSLGAMLDAHARLGELFAYNAALGDYATMHTQLRLVSTMSGPISLSGGRQMVADMSFNALDEARFLYLPSFQPPDTDDFATWLEEHGEFHIWLAQWIRCGVRVGACGAGVLHLAATGCLEGGECAVHPAIAGYFRQHFPGIRNAVLPRVVVQGKWLTCAYDGDAPGLVLRMFAEGFSPAIAQGLAIRSPLVTGDTAFPASRDPIVAQAQLWIRDRFTHDFRIADVAGSLGVSHQSLIRRFRLVTGRTPRDFVQSIRVEAAVSMLMETQRSVAEIAQLVGYVDIPSFRKAFVEVTGQTPSAYRKQRVVGD